MGYTITLIVIEVIFVFINILVKNMSKIK